MVSQSVRAWSSATRHSARNADARNANANVHDH